MLRPKLTKERCIKANKKTRIKTKTKVKLSGDINYP